MENGTQSRSHGTRFSAPALNTGRSHEGSKNKGSTLACISLSGLRNSLVRTFRAAVVHRYVQI
jgi:hypothetical protein